MTTSVYTVLTALRDQLATVAGVKTCRIGMENDIAATDYPIVRIVPSKLADGEMLTRRQAECLVYFGQPIVEADGGMEALYEAHLEMERALIDAAVSGSGYFCQYIETIMDEDRVPSYKLLALRVLIEG